MTNSINNQPSSTYAVGQRDTRPWGTWEVIDVGPAHIVKKITVNSKQILSLQSHVHRAEHWVIVQGVAHVTAGPSPDSVTITELRANQSVFLPTGTIHRIENRGTETMVFIEVQYGNTLREDDIVRYEDKYGRA